MGAGALQRRDQALEREGPGPTQADREAARDQQKSLAAAAAHEGRAGLKNLSRELEQGRSMLKELSAEHRQEQERTRQLELERERLQRERKRELERGLDGPDLDF